MEQDLENVRDRQQGHKAKSSTKSGKNSRANRERAAGRGKCDRGHWQQAEPVIKASRDLTPPTGKGQRQAS